MTIAQQVARVSTEQHIRARSNEFIQFARCFLQARGNLGEALIYAKQNYCADKVQSVLKSAVAAGGTTTNDWGSELATFSTAFAASLSSFGAVDRIFSDNAFVRLPMKTRVAVITTLVSGATVDESKPKKIAKIQFTNPTLDPCKSIAIVVVTEELARATSPAAFSLLGDELRKGVALATDVEFIRRILADGDVDTISSTGATLDAVVADLSTGLVLVNVGSNSRVYIIAPPKIVRAWALLRGTSGAPAFPELGILGGSISGATVVASNALTDKILIVDAQQVAVDAGPVFLDQASQTSLQLDDDPSDGEQKLTSLWQNDLRALRAERWWASQLLRSDGAAVITDVSVDVGTGT
jgi:Phage capsid family